MPPHSSKLSQFHDPDVARKMGKILEIRQEFALVT